MKIQNSFWSLVQFTTLACILIFLGGCVSAKQKKLDAGMKPIGDQEIKALFSEPFKASFLIHDTGKTVRFAYYPDGTAKFYGTRIDDEGTWHIENGEICFKWKAKKRGHGCKTWFKIDDNAYEAYRSDGSKSGILTIK
ncbi:MAG: hypothetical protein GY705_01665 [Bacteroidetes bacterium]|nr:hypothetical protein [Bacteroidota bacterium]